MHALLSKFKNKIALWRFRRYVVSQIQRGMRIGKNVMITPGVKFDPPHSFLTSIGDNCIIAPDVRFLNHDASLFGFDGFAVIGKITILENCFIGAGSILLPNITIGPNSIVGAGAVVTRDVPEDTIVAGNPAKPLKRVSEYREENRRMLDEKAFPAYQSGEFYPRLGDAAFIENVKSAMKSGKAFTIGGDSDFNFHFNR
jgi:maltose O-acetyltransferase